MALLPNATEEDRARVVFAIPEVLTALSIGDLAAPHWPDGVASRIYADWRRRTNQDGIMFYFDLSPDGKKPFRKIVDVIVQAQKTKKP
jgi:hypothetical protein